MRRFCQENAEVFQISEALWAARVASLIKEAVPDWIGS